MRKSIYYEKKRTKEVEGQYLRGKRRDLEQTQQVCMVDPNHLTYVRNGIKHWLRYKKGWLCAKCYHRLVREPKRKKTYKYVRKKKLTNN